MVQTIQARDITLHELETRFGLTLVEDEQFFREWQDNLPDITASEKQQLDRVKTNYTNLIKYPPLLENTVKMVVLSPLLDLANFYQTPPIKSEVPVEISAEDEGIIIKGQIDVLVLKEQLWILVIESKKAAFSIEVGLAQILTYMLGNPTLEKPSFGMITTGGSFIFIKLLKGTSQYATSRVFELRNPGNDLYSVLGILKRLIRF
jgi:hypothetical protein